MRHKITCLKNNFALFTPFCTYFCNTRTISIFVHCTLQTFRSISLLCIVCMHACCSCRQASRHISPVSHLQSCNNLLYTSCSFIFSHLLLRYTYMYSLSIAQFSCYHIVPPFLLYFHCYACIQLAFAIVVPYAACKCIQINILTAF